MTLQIVHLTDLHLRPERGDGRWEAFAKLCAELPELVGDFDRLVLTGDLAARGQLAVYEQLRAELEPWLSKVRLVPGNHDSSRLVRRVFADRLFDDAPRASFVDDVGGVRLIGLDSSRPWRVSGAIGREQLAWLADVLATPAPTVLFFHHPPLRVGTWWLDKDRLRDRNAFLRIIGGREILGIFCGHVHQEWAGRLGGVPVWTTPSTAYQFEPGSLIPRRVSSVRGGKAAALRRVEVAGGQLTTSVLRIGGLPAAP